MSTCKLKGSTGRASLHVTQLPRLSALWPLGWVNVGLTGWDAHQYIVGVGTRRLSHVMRMMALRVCTPALKQFSVTQCVLRKK